MSHQPALHDSPTVLLATLFAARRTGDGPLERLMLRRLSALGIQVQFTRVPQPTAARPATSRKVPRV